MSGHVPGDFAVPEVLTAEARTALSEAAPLRALAQLLVSKADDVPIPDLALSAVALRRAAPQDRAVWALTDALLYTQVPNYHWQMVADAPRNAAYAGAIADAVEPGMTVLEIGAGSGLLAMIAARSGAEHVYTIEANPLMAQVAQECVARNGYADRVTVLPGHSTNMEIGKQIPVSADVLIHEIFSADLLGEHVLPSVAHAKAELLAKNAPLLPFGIAAVGALAEPPKHRLTEDMAIDGLDLSPLTAIDAAITKYGPGLCARLSAPFALYDCDLRGAYPQEGRRDMRIAAVQAGTATGVEQWMHIEFPNNTALVADDRASHWQTCFHPFGAQLALDEGATVDISVEFWPGALAVGLAAQPAG
ncbi:MAG: 50S ribosomal protein L11 methyltransferase [Pseudomonadota bacterium]